MEQNQNVLPAKMNALDFFLHLGSIVALYVVVGNFINLLFRIINKSFPEVAYNYSYGYFGRSGGEISFPVATLIIVFPIFIVLSSLIEKTYIQNPDKKHLGVRKWLTYITLFIAGVILAGDLVTVLYKFLDGQDLTIAFLLKALVVLLVSGAVFGFYMADIRDRISIRSRKIWFLATSCLLLATIILGFSVIGSPKSQRLLRLDDQKIIGLQDIQWQVINYWQTNGMIPETMPSLQSDFKYQKTGNLTFELCTNFHMTNMMQGNQMMLRTSYPEKIGFMMNQNDNWQHGAGEHCFKRVIDPIQYPTQIRG
ncbi:MAG: DUF5671 domain-containing protein [Patescibacteria group bacterium]